MTYQLLEQYTSTFTGPPMVPKGFAIHWWGDPAERPTFYGTVNVLLERGRQESASVNFVAEAGIVACLVSPNTVAWGQGDGGAGWGNLNLVSIECNPRCTAGDRETVAELMADQHILNGVPLVAYPHNRFFATQCPGVWEQYIPWLVSRAKAIVATKQGKPAPKPATPVVPASSTPAKPKVHSDQDIHWVVGRGDTLSKIQRYYNGPSVAQIAAYNGIKVNAPLKIGQKIWIPGPLVWVIEKPDTIRSIARYYGLDPAYLARLNGLSGPDSTIYIGNQLTIKK